MKTLKKIGDKEALHIYSAYIEGIEVDFSKEYLSSFWTSNP
jgi:hypothetical protein